MKQTNRALVTTAIFIATFMSAIEGTIISTAMPTIVSSLNGLEIMNWVFSIYLLTGAVITPIYGKLSDKYGRKPIFIIGITLFIIGSLSCSLATSMIFLILSRFIQGIGAGAILPISMTIIADLYPSDKRASIIGLNNAAWGIASILAPMIGGIIVEKFSWHWIFLINVPIGIIVLLCMYFGFIEKWDRMIKTPMDIKGTIYLSITLLSSLYFFQISSETMSMKPIYMILIIISIISFYLLIKNEKKAIDPIISLDLFKSRSFVIINLVAFLVGGFLISLDVYIPMWLQLLNDQSASLSGMSLASMSIMWMMGSFLVGKLINKISIKLILFIGTLILSIGSSVIAFFDINTAYLSFVLIGVLLGIGFGMTITTTTISVQEQVSEQYLGVATSLNMLFRTLGQTIMISLYGMIFNIKITQTMNHYPEVNSKLVNKFLNIQDKKDIAINYISKLKEIIYSGLHQIFTLSSLLVIFSLILIGTLFVYNKSNRQLD